MTSPFTKVVRISTEATRREIRIWRGDESEVCRAHVHKQPFWVGDVLDPLEAHGNVKVSEIKRLVHAANFKLRAWVVPLGLRDGVGGDVDPLDTDGARSQQEVRAVPVAAAEIDD